MLTPDAPEIEAKILDIGSEIDLSDQLIELWAQLIFEWELRAQWLININREAVRVRQEWTDRVSIEHKRKIEWWEPGIKQFQETGFVATDYDSVIATLLALWLTTSGLPSVKRRVSFLLQWARGEDDIRFDIDTYSDLEWHAIPTLLEIESSTIADVRRGAQMLGYGPEQLCDYWPRELLAHYSKI
jgi:hypothetical protein